MRRLNNKGVVLVASYLVIIMLLIMGAGLFTYVLGEFRSAGVARDSGEAFWKAEGAVQDTFYKLKAAGINWLTIPEPPSHLDYTANVDGNDVSVELVYNSAEHKIEISSQCTESSGQSPDVTRTVSVDLDLEPDVLDPNGAAGNTLSIGGDPSLSDGNLLHDGLGFSLFGMQLLGKLRANGNTKMRGTYQEINASVGGSFESKTESALEGSCKVPVPDTDGNGTAEEFRDYVQYTRETLSEMNPAEYEYIKLENDGDTAVIHPSSTHLGKKIIYVEGPSDYPDDPEAIPNPGSGDVTIIFDATWRSGEDITVISTGDIIYAQPINLAGSQVNTMSWGNYTEGSILLDQAQGVHFTNTDMVFLNIVALSQSTGNYISNGNMSAYTILANKTFNFNSRLMSGNFPPGFDGLFAGMVAQWKLGSELTNWRTD